MTQQNRIDLKAGWVAAITDGGANTAAEVRQMLDNLADSCFNILTDNSITFANTGLKVLDTNASHSLTIAAGSNITADRTLTITTGDASRTLTLTGDFTATGSTSGTNTGDQTTVTGNAGTATALQNARTIGGVSFDGTANIVPQTIQSVNEASDTTCFLLFISNSGSQSLQPLNNTSLTFNASTAHMGAGAFIPSSSTAPTNGMYLPNTNNLAWAINSTGELQLTASTLAPFSDDGLALGSTARQFSDVFLATGAVVNWNNGNVTLTQSSGALALNAAWNTSVTTTFAGSTASIDAAAILGQDVVTWTPASTPTLAFVTSRMRKTIANATSASITGLSHPIGGYDWLVVDTGANTLDLAFVHEAKYTKSGAGVNTNLVFYKPALDTVAGSITNITLFDGDMDLSGITYTNAYLMNCNRSYLKLRTSGLIETSGGDQQVVPRDRPAVVTNNYYPLEGVTGLFAATTHTRNLAWAVPWVCPERTTWTRAGFTNGTGVASSVGRMGIYKDSAGRPGARIADFGTVTAGVADTGAREITISQLLDPGIYWLVLALQGGATDNAITYASVNSWSIMGMPSNTAQDGCCYVAAAGALPDPFGTPTATGGGFAPFMWMRKV